jgi:MazG family protein
MKKQDVKADISKLLEIMAALRDPDSGCPWDLAQDFDTIAPYTIEEAYEVADCIERDALDELPDELGDLLLQVVFHAQMGKDRGLFAFDDVVGRICDKMVRRHPHVFGGGSAGSGEDLAQSWEQIKQAEQPGRQSLLDGIALGLPALTRASKIGRRAASVGFDWSSLEPVRAKIDEELDELDTALSEGRSDRVESEVGDLLFSIANLCRHLRVDPERALRRANDRFVRRFGHVEGAVRAAGDWSDFGIDALEALWQRAKDAEREEDP